MAGEGTLSGRSAERLERLSEAVGDALALLEGATPTIADAARLAAPLPSLLEQCEALAAEAAAPEPDRVVLAVDDAAARMAVGLLGLLPNLHVAPCDAPPDEVAAAAAQAEAHRRRGMRLVRIMPLSAAARLPPESRVLVMIRHPAAVWISARLSGFGLTAASTLDARAAEIAAALDAAPRGVAGPSMLRRDAVEHDPAHALDTACAALDLALPGKADDLAALLPPDALERPAAPLALPDGSPAIEAPLDSPAYVALCARLGYDPARLPETERPAPDVADPLPTGRLTPPPGRLAARLGATLDRLLALEARPGPGPAVPPDIAALIARLDACLADPLSAPEALDAAAADLPRRDAALFLTAAAAHRAETGDALLALDLMADAEDALPPDAAAQGLLVLGAEVYLRLHRPSMALALLARDAFQGPLALAPAARERLLEAIFGAERSGAGEHGHAVLIDRLSAHPPARGPRLMVEVGTTRERVPGQGSTEKLARFCAERALDFVTVDMDPRNAARAQRTFRRLGLPFRAVAAKGEDWLAAHDGRIDYVFLDAYDFDHGGHSAQRQSRYEAFLGDRIDDTQCHRMHLDCARALADKLAPDGLICLDDAWTDEQGRWTAKGATAVPFLLRNGFKVIEARNRSALLARA